MKVREARTSATHSADTHVQPTGLGNMVLHQASPDSTRQQQAAAGSSRQQQAAAGSSGQQQAAAGSSRQQQAAAGSSRQHQAAPGSTSQHQAAPGSTRQHQAAPAIAVSHAPCVGCTVMTDGSDTFSPYSTQFCTDHDRFRSTRRHVRCIAGT